MKICALIPAYNEAKTILPLIQETQRYIPDVIVLDDGSQDETLQLVQQTDAKVLINRVNQGKGITLRRGFEYALQQGFDWILTMDGDGQHNPGDIPVFLDILKREQDCIVIGNRMYQRNQMPWIRWITNQTMSKIISKIVKQYIPDTQCGYRLIHRRVLAAMPLLKSKKFEIESELVIEAARAGFKIISIPIHSIYQGQESQIKPLRDTIRFLRLLLRYIDLS